jgi:hypothetical protein
MNDSPTPFPLPIPPTLKSSFISMVSKRNLHYITLYEQTIFNILRVVYYLIDLFSLFS